MAVFWGIISLFVLVGCNAFFVAAEFALVSVRRTRMESLVAEGNTRAERVMVIHHNLDFYIAATQLGITMASLGLGFVAEPAVALLVAPPMLAFGAAPALVTTMSFTVAFTLSTCMHIVLGELAPKTIALERAEQASLVLALPLIIFGRIFKPVILFMNYLGNNSARLLLGRVEHASRGYTPQELMLIVSASSQAGEIYQNEKDLLENVLEFRQTSVRNIMINRTEMLAVAKGTGLRRVVELRRESGHSRYPVYGDSLDDIIGFIHVGDVLYMADSIDTAKVEEIMQPAHFVPESMKVANLFGMFKNEKVHQAVVVDEYGGTAGLITMEDVLEEIVGDIYDETDAVDQSLRQVSPGVYVVEGQAHLYDVEETLNVDFKNEDYETIGGLISAQLGHIPQPGEMMDFDGWRFVVTRADARAVRQVRVFKTSLS